MNRQIAEIPVDAQMHPIEFSDGDVVTQIWRNDEHGLTLVVKRTKPARNWERKYSCDALPGVQTTSFWRLNAAIRYANTHPDYRRSMEASPYDASREAFIGTFGS